MACKTINDLTIEELRLAVCCHVSENIDLRAENQKLKTEIKRLQEQLELLKYGRILNGTEN